VSVLALNGISFRYKSAKSPILRGLDLVLQRGECVAISGPSGGGKSTLCLIASTIIPTRITGELAGSAELMGESTLKLGPAGASRHLAFVTQEPEYSMIMPTVEEELAFGLENRSWPADAISARVDELIIAFGLGALAGRNPVKLSGGEKQAVAIAAAAAARPSLLILDEAFSGLDEERYALAQVQMQKLKRDGTAILLVEHASNGRAKHAWVDRQLLLSGGLLSEVAR
jgi:energy-coupling factor transporter ATP-binding protein EcfA2